MDEYRDVLANWAMAMTLLLTSGVMLALSVMTLRGGDVRSMTGLMLTGGMACMALSTRFMKRMMSAADGA